MFSNSNDKVLRRHAPNVIDFVIAGIPKDSDQSFCKFAIVYSFIFDSLEQNSTYAYFTL